MDVSKTGVYVIENLVNGKKYVGSCTRSFRQTWNGHKTDLRRNVHHSQKLQRAYNKYGAENFKFDILGYYPPCFVLKAEQHFIDTIKPEYNICKIAGNSYGVKRTEEQQDRHKKFMAEYYSDENNRQRAREKTLLQFSDPLARQRAREKSLAQFSDPVQREKQRKIGLARFSDPEAVEKARQKSLAQFSDPKQIEKSRDGHSRFVYEILRPDGGIDTTISIKHYADTHGLKHSPLYNTLRGYNCRGVLARTHKGYKIISKTPRQK